MKQQNTITVADFQRVIKEIQHVPSRVPYTYHHDYLRTNSPKFKNKSRGDVGQEHISNDLELYATALIYLFDMSGSQVLEIMNDEEMGVSREAKKVVQGMLKMYETVSEPSGTTT
jgi:hypothetical protein